MTQRPPGYHVPPKWSTEQGTPRPVRCADCSNCSIDETLRHYCFSGMPIKLPPIVSKFATCDHAKKKDLT